MQITMGWDVGGAHLKATRAENGVITRAVQIASPLWHGLETLERAFFEAETSLGQASLNAVTMTGELCDAFTTRAEGVTKLAAAMSRLLALRRVVFYAGRSGFVDVREIPGRAVEIASANWHASTALTAARAQRAFHRRRFDDH